MKQRIKLAFKILFCKSYFFTDCEMYYTENFTINDCKNISELLTEIVENVTTQESILNEAKQILCQKQ